MGLSEPHYMCTLRESVLVKIMLMFLYLDKTSDLPLPHMTLGIEPRASLVLGKMLYH